MNITLPDPHPGRCLNHRVVRGQSLRCLNYEIVPHVCEFPEPVPPPARRAQSYTQTISEPAPWQRPGVPDDPATETP